jgi:hypothetical protein
MLVMYNTTIKYIFSVVSVVFVLVLYNFTIVKITIITYILQYILYFIS